MQLFNWLLFFVCGVVVYSLANKLSRRNKVEPKLGIEEYLGTNLYDIDSTSAFTRLRKAMDLMDTLKKYPHVTYYNNKPIESFDKFTLEKLELQVGNNNFDGCTTNKPEI